MRELPSGTVTFLFTDVEGSTKLLHELGPERYADALAEHRRVLRDAFTPHGGVEVDTQGDAFFVAFPTAPAAIEAVKEAQAALAVPVRMGLHTGTPHLTEEGYVGADVHRAARVAAAGHGGQVLVSASTAALLDEGLKDLGEHRLKDLSAPERIYQLGEAEFAPLKTLYRSNLPVPATPFLGRRQELAEVEDLLLRHDVRLLTLTGPGGTGKTRLGLQAAAEAADAYPDGVFWVPLAPLRDLELVLEHVAQAVGANDGLADYVGDKRLLLLLDNFEHLIEAADELDRLRTSCPNLKLLVTSRELLGLPGEQAYPVPPLEPTDGTDLFIVRARAARPDFEPDEIVPELCARLEQLPLALELAAARVRVLSPAQLLERLSDRLDVLKAGRGVDPRQQTLRATIEWSHELLHEEEQRLFARLAVFAGGCTLEAAEAICDADLDTLQSLVDKSLARARDEGRFWMLETIREFALERLEASGEAEELRRRHAERFLGLVEEAEPSILGMRPEEWLDRLESEHDNIRAALDWLEGAGETERALLLAGTIWEFWCLRGHAAEGWRRLEHLLDLDHNRTLARAKAATGSAHLAPQVPGAGTEQRRRRDLEAVELYRELDDPWGIAYAEYQLATSYALDGEFARALPLVEESMHRLREVGDEHRALQALRSVAWCTLEVHGVERAKPLYEELRDRANAEGDTQLEPRALNVLAGFAGDEGRHERALQMMKRAYRIDREYGDPGEIASDLVYIARALALADRPIEAVQLLSCADAQLEKLGIAFPGWVLELHAAAETRAREQLDDAEFDTAWEKGRKLTPDEAVALAFDPD